MNDKRKAGRPATGRSTKQVRIPIVLEPAVRELVATYERLRWQSPRNLGRLSDNAPATLEQDTPQ